MEEVKRPIAVNIFGEWIKIKHVKQINEDDNLKIYGDYNSHTDIIRISEDQSDREAMKTYLHEIMHVLLRKSGASELIDEKFEETLCVVVEYLQNLVYFKNDPKFIRYQRKKD